MKPVWISLFLVLCGVYNSIASPPTQTVFEIIKNEPQLSKFLSLIQTHSQIIHVLMTIRPGTVFAPTDEAFAKWNKDLDTVTEQFLLYHLSNTYVVTESFPKHREISTEVEGNLPVWLWVKNHLNVKIYYVNNAKIVRKDLKGQTSSGGEQVVHMIDEVLEPIIAKSSDSSYNNPDAFKFMSNPLAFGLHNYELSEFDHCVHNSPRRHVFTASEGSTYFMPINSGFAKFNKSYIDSKVIDVHVIYNKVLFTRAFGKDEFPSNTPPDSVKVQLSLLNETSFNPISNNRYDLYVQSNIRVGDFNTLRTGVVVAKILKANIPIKNGVVHIIDRPLVTTEMNVREILEEEKGKRLSELYYVINSTANSLLNVLETANPITFFAPSNEAIFSLPQSQQMLLRTEPEAVRKLLELHIVPQSLSTQMMGHQVSMTVTAYDQVRKLSLKVVDITEPPHKNYTVEGGGANASIITPNIMAKNGVVHIINRFLGLPFESMFDKLVHDEDIKESFIFGLQERWNDQFKVTNMVFTYFVPDNDAWKKIKTHMAAEYLRLQGLDQAYHLKHILDRHLIRYAQYNIDSLVSQEKIQTVRGNLVISRSPPRENSKDVEYWIEWAGVKAKIKRPDIRTTNGIIHVIDTVLMRKEDLSPRTNSAEQVSMLTTALVMLFVHVLA